MKFKILSGNALKIVASIIMLVDHIGKVLFPKIVCLRIIGRLAFPIFAFLVAEGCKYTRNKMKYWGLMTIFGLVCQVVFSLFGYVHTVNILLTFSLSILMIYALQYFKYNLLNKEKKPIIKAFSGIMLVSVITIVWFVNRWINIDYGFWGCVLPLIVSVFHYAGDNYILKGLDNNYLKSLAMIIVLIILSIAMKSIMQLFSIFSIILVLMYSGNRGKINMKYVFYVFYPVHLVALYIIEIIFM